MFKIHNFMELFGIYFGHYKTHGLFIYLKSKQYSTCLKNKTIYIAIQQEILLKPFGSSICNVEKHIVAFTFLRFQHCYTKIMYLY